MVLKPERRAKAANAVTHDADADFAVRNRLPFGRGGDLGGEGSCRQPPGDHRSHRTDAKSLKELAAIDWAAEHRLFLYFL